MIEIKYIVRNIKAEISELTIENEVQLLKNKVSRKCNISIKDIKSFKIAKESVDARKNDIFIVYSLVIEVESMLTQNNDVSLLLEETEGALEKGIISLRNRPVIVGSGPAGLFAALLLSEYGFRPIIIERGLDVDSRTKIVNKFWEEGILDTETNVQFGEGGAGTFSDGKLVTRINDKRCRKVLETFYENGAPEEILYKAKPHIGTDILKSVVKSIRKKIESLGGTFYFGTKLENINLLNSQVHSINTNRGQMDVNALILAIGHSSRDTFDMLLKNGIEITQKPFSAGFRIEHKQEMINKNQYGTNSNHFKLGAAEYQLFQKVKDRTVYSFCMCPGGIVVASASEEDTIVTNGMSEYKRDGENANSALVVSIGTQDFESSHPLAGIELQRKMEKKAFELGGRDYSAPVQLFMDFLEDKKTISFGEISPSYTGNTVMTDLNCCVPKYISDSIKASANLLDRKINGFVCSDAILTGVETRTSSPVRIQRNDTFESLSVEGVYPCGEGAGYAGGIVSAAVDGLKCAEALIKKYSPPKK